MKFQIDYSINSLRKIKTNKNKRFNNPVMEIILYFRAYHETGFSEDELWECI